MTTMSTEWDDTRGWRATRLLARFRASGLEGLRTELLLWVLFWHQTYPGVLGEELARVVAEPETLKRLEELYEARLENLCRRFSGVELGLLLESAQASMGKAVTQVTGSFSGGSVECSFDDFLIRANMAEEALERKRKLVKAA